MIVEALAKHARHSLALRLVVLHRFRVAQIAAQGRARIRISLRHFKQISSFQLSRLAYDSIMKLYLYGDLAAV